MSRPAADEIAVERDIAAPAERLWTLWVTPALKRQWWGRREGGELVECLTEPWVHGRISYAMKSGTQPGKVERAQGNVLAVEAGRRLAFTWSWVEDGVPPMRTVVEMSLRPAGLRTQVSIRHRGQPSARVAAVHERGWTDKLADLEAAAAQEASGCATRYWEAAANGDWAGASVCLAARLVLQRPHCGGWRGEDALNALERMVASGQISAVNRITALSAHEACAEVLIEDAEGACTVASFAESRQGRIVRLREIFARHAGALNAGVGE